MGIIYHARELVNIFTDNEAILVLVIRILAIVGGVFTLRGANWARWLLTVWIVYHVVLSLSHSNMELIMHIAITLVTVIALFNRRANEFFRLRR